MEFARSFAPFGGPAASQGSQGAAGNMANIQRGMALAPQDPKQASRGPLGDLTNNGAQQAAGKKPGQQASAQAQVPFRASLPHEAFLDPRIIDGVRYSEFHDQDKQRRRQDWVDVDALNHEDPQAVSHYAPAIFEYLREAELLKRANPGYLDVQPEINIKMRTILVDWLVEVAEEYKLCADTLYLAVNFLDRFLSLHRVQRMHLQLSGITCMWLAAKFEEIYPPNVSEFAYITDNTYTREQLVGMEEQILKTLKYELAMPTSKTFLRRLLQVCNPDDQLHFLSNYLTEISLLDSTMLHYLPSETAAAAVYLSNLMLRRAPWSGTLQHYSYYAPADIAPCIEALASVHMLVSTRAQTGELTAMYDKYSHTKYLAVARMQPLPCAYVQQHLTAMLSESGSANADRFSGCNNGSVISQ